MYYYNNMSATFEAEKNRKAFIYTSAIVIVLMLLAFLWTWNLIPPPTPLVQDLIEINLGNYEEGFGTVQPILKGEKSPGDQPAERQQQSATTVNNEPAKDVQPDENADEDAAPIVKPDKAIPKATNISKQPTTQTIKNNTPTPVVVSAPKPQKPKIAGYNGPKNDKGNGAPEDNGYTYQGNKPGGKGDAGNPNGKPDSYGTNPGGRPGGGPKVTGDRKIVRYYSFTGDLDKATIFAIVKVSPEGIGRFTGFAKNSTSRSQAYANSITEYLRNIKFDPADHESTVTVQFNFNVQ
jgi:outer membrane biosynthesis protein TonB